MNPISAIAKRGIDLVVASASLVALSPLLALTAAAVRLDSRGPAFFRQERLGARGRVFRIWKFRTMTPGAGVSLDERGNVVNVRDDPRHTRVGRWLRHTSIDELPQLVNVVLGDMSLIGPRPDLPEALSLYTPEERAKLAVRPGITGLAQALGRNALSAHDKWALDARYAREASLALDARIMVLTLEALARRRGIYASDESARRRGGRDT